MKDEDGKIKILTTNKSNIFANENKVKNFIVDREIVCIPWGGNPIVQYYNGKFITSDNRIATSIDKNILSNKFLYYYFENNIEKVKEFYRGSGIKHPDMSKILDMEIWLPPLELQNKIVAILDKFQDAIENSKGLLPQEIELRKMQYEYYRDKLLSFDIDITPERERERERQNSIEIPNSYWILLEQAIEYIKNKIYKKIIYLKLRDKTITNSINTGLNPRNNFNLNDESNEKLVAWYITTKDYSENQEIIFDINKTAKITEAARKLINKRSKLEKNDILFSGIGTVGKVALVDFEPYNFDISESTYAIKVNQNNIMPKFLMHYLRSSIVQNQIFKDLKGSTLKGIRKVQLENLLIPIIPLEIQNKIVNILDKFQKAIEHSKGLLPQEIKLREQQYEYYCDKLLNFKK
ncbi:restriction endonuclease subunit S [Mesomycoplasma lagogenitalium]|uniref:Restriction endonuclease subunit S n=2 Tax=Mesomycoplasma lagogenitalium TaxID=171286 RepID=A0ABY8LWW5_9BACT|nr:restriction endonuclease subunit S [Mesomycoplasma lagogenitalium]WGI37063.1 restriction endonuclease subunit S [Mesomycoplasma lagogenitalium]